jgi:DNA-binding transcriptional LysR family regulator
MLDVPPEFLPLDLKMFVLLGAGHMQSEIAAALRVDQSAVSRSIRRLEKQSGLQLIQRDGRRLTLTAAGREFARVADRAIRRLENIDALVASLRAGHAGRITVIASNSLGSYALPPVMAEFSRRYPDAHIDVDIVPNDDVMHAFGGGGYDFAIVARSAFAEELVAEPLFDDPLVIFAAPSSPFAARTTVRIEDLLDGPVVARFAGGYWPGILLALERRGLRLARRVDLRSSEAVKRVVESGVGVGVLFHSAVRAELASGRLVRLPVETGWPAEKVCLVWRRDLPVAGIAALFRGFLIAHLT